MVFDVELESPFPQIDEKRLRRFRWANFHRQRLKCHKIAKTILYFTQYSVRERTLCTQDIHFIPGG